MLVHDRGSEDRDARKRKCAAHKCSSAKMHVPKRDAHTPSSPLHPCRTSDSTSDVSDDSVSYLRLHQLWTLLPTLPTACVVAEKPSSPFPTTPPPRSRLHILHIRRPPPASVVDSIIYPTSVGNRIAAVQAVLSSEHAQTPVTLSSDQLKAILRIPLSPSPFMHVVDVIALRSDVSTTCAPRIPPPSPASLASATIATGTNFPTSSAAVTAAIFCQSTPTTLKGEAELCSSRRSQQLTFSKLPSQTADKLPPLYHLYLS